MQGGTDPHTSLATNHSVISEPKHYGGHSWPESGLNTAPAHMGRRDLETIFLPTFKAAVTEAGARSVMAAYNEIDGIPNANNEDLLYEHLRNQWGFDGFVLSDEGAVSQALDEPSHGRLAARRHHSVPHRRRQHAILRFPAHYLGLVHRRSRRGWQAERVHPRRPRGRSLAREDDARPLR